MVGNGGLGGGLNFPDCGAGIRRGFACATTDTGHSSSLFDGSWAYNNTETVIDWGYRAMHLSVVLSKQIVQQYYAPKQ
jgi:feruloyl esterase